MEQEQRVNLYTDEIIRKALDLKEDNILIAKFMGAVLSSVPNLINLPQTRGDANIHSVKGSEVLPNGTYSVHRLSELKYHKSWDWLMPVIDKCYQEHMSKHIADAVMTCDINKVYKVVVEFINQLNK